MGQVACVSWPEHTHNRRRLTADTESSRWAEGLSGERCNWSDTPSLVLGGKDRR